MTPGRKLVEIFHDKKRAGDGERETHADLHVASRPLRDNASAEPSPRDSRRDKQYQR